MGLDPGGAARCAVVAVGGGRAGAYPRIQGGMVMAEPGRAVRILLVENHLDTLMAQAILLRKRGYEVKTAGDAEAALEAAEAGDLDLVISDIHLPDRSGLELMRELKAAHDMKGIALTGSGDAEDVRGSIEAGFAKHLVKPVLPEQLEEAIEETVS